MSELGEESERGHREVGEAAAALGIDELIAVGETGAEIARAAQRSRLGEKPLALSRPRKQPSFSATRLRPAIWSWSRAAVPRGWSACWKSSPSVNQPRGSRHDVLPPSPERRDQRLQCLLVTSPFAPSRRRSPLSCSRLLFGNFVIRKLISLKVGQPIRTAEEVHRLAELHGGKQGVPTMGGVLIIGAVVLSSVLWARPDNPLRLARPLRHGLPRRARFCGRLPEGHEEEIGWNQRPAQIGFSARARWRSSPPFS